MNDLPPTRTGPAPGADHPDNDPVAVWLATNPTHVTHDVTTTTIRFYDAAGNVVVTLR